MLLVHKVVKEILETPELLVRKVVRVTLVIQAQLATLEIRERQDLKAVKEILVTLEQLDLKVDWVTQVILAQLATLEILELLVRKAD